MEANKVKQIVIVGGGTAGWMTAAALAKVLKGQYPIRLVESDEIGTVGVGEATIPMVQVFNRMLELDEDEFMRRTQASFKLGIEFVNWGKLGDRYIHGFGVIGQDNWTVDFHQYWLKQYMAGKAKELVHYSINTAACLQNKFVRAQPDMPNSPLSQIAHAFHFDASLYAKFLREFSEARGVERLEGKIVEVRCREGDGHVEALQLQSGQWIEGDLFVDCSGFRALLIEGALKTGYVDWSHWLPCDRALAVPCVSASAEITPYTRATARQSGWQWRIPLQHRVGNGHVYCSKYISDDEAASVLLSNLDGEPLASPRPIKFLTGKRSKTWNKNVVSIGLSSGFLEPLESTSIHLIQMGIGHLLTYFPSAGFDEADRAEYNRIMDQEYEWVRDFIILHYKATERTDSPFWNYCRTMDVPESLAQRMRLFESHGRVYREGNELFTKISWLQVLHGQRIRPKSYHPLVDLLPEAEIQSYLEEVEQVITACVEVMPSHAKFVAENCSSVKM
ncbi:tryptophan halogenase family protein [Roseateles saccharophilus]|uniref:Tryptophan halogenase n=1 Tax=Roseateles saccharophilus TaxID=304 RepID=A0A4R3VAA0_ROSSA|nr:tryptophan halogenase family protein [Roseateles saccharophilus]MDG0835014.1 tryptophan 7-halogenase [Roseateles saccharophilus]TCV00399.1 tryptophan halogenase [Roseateles saccharophilus]